MVYLLFVTTIISGEIHESMWEKRFKRFEECWEIATSLTHNRSNIAMRCVAVDEKTLDDANNNGKHDVDKNPN